MNKMGSLRALLLVTMLLGLEAVAQAAPVAFTVLLTGADRVPAVRDQSAATATARFTYDEQTRTITWDLDYSGVHSAVTAAQLRGPALPGKNGRLLVRMSAKAEKGEQIASPVKGKATFSSRQAKALAAGDIYVVLDSTDHPNGELRGQLLVPKS